MERELTKKLTAATNCTTAENFRAATLYSSVLRETDISFSRLIYFVRSNLIRDTDSEAPFLKPRQILKLDVT